MGLLMQRAALIMLVLSGSLVAVTAARADPTNIATPRITGVALPGRTLTATPGKWEITGGVSYAYAWVRCNAAGKSCVPLKSGGRQVVGRKLRVPAKLTGTLRVSVLASDSSGTAAALSPPVKIRRA